MPFEYRIVTYFVCSKCKHEYPIKGSLLIGGIHKCTAEGCNYEESFQGNANANNYNVQIDTPKKTLWHNPIFQNIIGGLVLLVLVSAYIYCDNKITSNDFKREITKIESKINSLKGVK